MNYQLIMLPNPILVSDEKDVNGYFPKVLTRDYEIEDSIDGENLDWLLKHGSKVIIAGLPELPQLDLSLVAGEIGYVDVEKLAKEYIGRTLKDEESDEHFIGRYSGFKEGFNANPKKYTEEDMIRAIEMAQEESWDEGGYLGLEHTPDEILKLLQQPKVYNVEVEMDIVDGCNCKSIGYTVLGSSCSERNRCITPKMTNNTIKVTKII